MGIASIKWGLPQSNEDCLPQVGIDSFRISINRAVGSRSAKMSLDSLDARRYIWGYDIGVWRSLAARMLWEHDVGGSNPLTPI